MSDSLPSFRDSDAAVVDLLRGDAVLGIGELAGQLGVTATAVRQRLDRLMRAGIVERKAESRPRGRPAHVYSLTAAGRRLGGDNFRDLAMVLWREIRSVREPSVRQGLLNRIAGSLADVYREQVSGQTPTERLTSVAAILGERGVSCVVEQGAALPVLTSYSCPYPDLAEQDRSICAAERLMLQDLVGAAVQLSECRLDGAACCRFTAAGDAGPPDAAASLPPLPQGLERKPIPSSNAGRL
ncbi:MAG: winged helix-turn-helix transcriptional regulator [Planctomycetia bacterium]|nr:winged helix-turn-helix transcriptional regulator [Planctomycetia bacterium]